MKEITLIANTGLQFICNEIEFNPSETIQVGESPTPTLYFAEYPSGEPNVNCFELAYPYQNNSYLVSELREQGCVKQVSNILGDEKDLLDIAGQPVIDRKKINDNTLYSIPRNQCYGEYNIEGSFQLFDNEGNSFTPFQRILGKWIPVPMFLFENDETFDCTPTEWCRLRIDEIEKGKKTNRYRLTWAFDTAKNCDEYDKILPEFPENTKYLQYSVCNRISQYIAFLDENDWVSNYMAQLIFGQDVMPAYPVGNFIQRCRHMGFYISLFTQLRLIPGACPVVKLFNDDLTPISVDLVLDIGNSRTCGVIYEDHDLTKGTLLSLTDIQEPWRNYSGSFDMRLAFHRTEFGEDNMGLGNVFGWRSFVRVGEEAHRLIACEQKNNGQSARLTHHSSPKRYLWDSEPFSGKWEFLLTTSEPVAPQRDTVYVKFLSEQLKVDGTFRLPQDTLGDIQSEGSSFSRRSLMTMVMIEILQQAMLQINSYNYRDIETGRGNEDRKRVIENIIVTCPTAMSQEEQIILRKCAHDAMIAIIRSRDPEVLFTDYVAEEWEDMVSIVPSESDLRITRQEMFDKKVEWGFDEATCCQMVYLYSEIVDRYRGDGRKLIEAKGHIRPEFKNDGYEKSSLTIGSIDIGAGTTDLMICSYQYDQQANSSTLTPIPLFWDSFNLAGDDLLREIVLRVVLRDPSPTGKPIPGYGSIYNAILCNMAGARLNNLRDDEYEYLSEAAKAKVVGFFSNDAPALTELDRIMRNDFNVQVSVPIAQKMMDMMKNLEVARDVTYEEIFANNPPSPHLLEYFDKRFGIQIQSLRWNYSPEIITECIRSRIEPLLKQLSIILHSYQVDVVLLAGRPTSLEAITDLFLEFFPVSPDRLIRLLPRNDNLLSSQKKWNCYKVGRWFPSSDSMGYFLDLKPVVAVGAVVAYKGEHGFLPNFNLDMSKMRKRMTSTANFIGSLDISNDRIHSEDIMLSPDKSTFSFTCSLNGRPFYLGCKQINTEYYQSRPLYVVKVKTGESTRGYDLSRVRVTINRVFSQNKELLTLQNAIDRNNQPITDLLELSIQSIVLPDCNGATGSYWLDNGAFSFN
ncbi:MAG: virulence factor SrfB [Muribaculaceae bacterium]|nr:virulence factor SrfB [Muribaculaceae bacterium]